MHEAGGSSILSRLDCRNDCRFYQQIWAHQVCLHCRPRLHANQNANQNIQIVCIIWIAQPHALMHTIKVFFLLLHTSGRESERGGKEDHRQMLWVHDLSPGLVELICSLLNVSQVNCHLHHKATAGILASFTTLAMQMPLHLHAHMLTAPPCLMPSEDLLHSDHRAAARDPQGGVGSAE